MMTTGLDLSVMRFLDAFHGRSPAFDALVEVLEANDLVKGGLLVAIVFWFWHQPHPAQPERRRLIVATVAGTVLAIALSRTLTHLFPFTTRPFQTPGLDLPVPLPLRYAGRDSSFPSDTSALLFGLVTSLWLLSRRLGVAAAAYVVALVWFPRAYLGIHWAGDLVAGAAVGVAVTAAFAHPRVREPLARAAERLQARAPGAFHAAMFLLAFMLTTRFDAARAVLAWASATVGRREYRTTAAHVPPAPPVATSGGRVSAHALGGARGAPAAR